MLKLSESEIIDRIAADELFECESTDGSYSLKVESYTPSICVALHAGHRFRTELMSKCALNEAERLYEEDPYTDQIIQAMPIVLIANESRYEYDLNRPLASCIYNKAWGKVVWNKKLTAHEHSVSIRKHQSFYRVLDALVQRMERKFGAALIFDVHSYNFLRRQESDTPTFNLGTEQLNMERWSSIVRLALKSLAKITLPNMPVTVKENSVFYGRGYLISHVNSRFENTSVLPIEIKKIYMDELTGEPYPLVMQSLVKQFRDCMFEISTHFARRFVRKRRIKKAHLLTDKMDPAVLSVDRSLYKLAKGLETLVYINPINIPGERKKFFKSHGNYEPKFHYKQLNIDPYHFREQLYRLPVAEIKDPGVQGLYRDVVDSFSEKIDLLVKAGKSNFLYESLKYYGEPSLTDKQNAHFILHAKAHSQPELPSVDTEELIYRFKETASQWGMMCKVESSAKLVALAMVSNARKAVIVGKDLRLTETEANALIQHELGVHMATTLNASKQKLKVFSLGLPGNTLTQEGLAILNEYQSGHITLKRLKDLALRVLAVKEMVKHGDFRHTFSYLHEEHHMSEQDAFKLSVRVHRGGGFTKDYLYLNGVSQAIHCASSKDLRNLYVGKTGFDYLDVLNEMVERQWVSSPKFYPSYLTQPAQIPEVLKYLMSCIRSSDSACHSDVQAAFSIAS